MTDVNANNRTETKSEIFSWDVLQSDYSFIKKVKVFKSLSNV